MFSHKNDSKKILFPGTVLDSLFTILNWSPITRSFFAINTQYLGARPRTHIKQGRFAGCVSKTEELLERLNAGFAALSVLAGGWNAAGRSQNKPSAAAISRHCVLSQGCGSWTLVEMGAIPSHEIIRTTYVSLCFSPFLYGIFPICSKIMFFILGQCE